VAKEVISRCDVCGATEDVQEITITPEGDPSKTVDLCPEHGGPVLELYALGVEGDPKPKTKRRPGRPSSHSVVPIEEWDGQPTQ
jgi:hypothetical protein